MCMQWWWVNGRAKTRGPESHHRHRAPAVGQNRFVRPPPAACQPLCTPGAAPVRTMRIASNGQRTAHSAHPVQPAASCSADRLGPQLASPCTCRDSTCGAHTATHQPQPVQRSVSMAGRALRGGVMRWGIQGVVRCLGLCTRRVRCAGCEGRAAVGQGPRLRHSLPRCTAGVELLPCRNAGPPAAWAGPASPYTPGRGLVSPCASSPAPRRHSSLAWGSSFAGAGGTSRAACRTRCTAALRGPESCSPRWPAAPS